LREIETTGFSRPSGGQNCLNFSANWPKMSRIRAITLV
jgi:hypothetical protein